MNNQEDYDLKNRIVLLEKEFNELHKKILQPEQNNKNTFISTQNNLVSENLSESETKSFNVENTKLNSYKILNNSQYETTTQNKNNNKVKYGMKWFYFIIYFGLFAAAIQLSVSGIMTATGAIYVKEGIHPNIIYSVFPDLKIINIIYGVCMVCLACYAVFVRFSLAKFHKDSPIYFFILYLFDLFLSILYAISIGATGTIDAVSPTLWIGIVYKLIMLCINYIYFKNREDLFCVSKKNTDKSTNIAKNVYHKTLYEKKEFELWLIKSGYKEFKEDGKEGAVYQYSRAVDSVVKAEELSSWEELKDNIDFYIEIYSISETSGNSIDKKRRALTNALNKYREFLNYN